LDQELVWHRDAVLAPPYHYGHFKPLIMYTWARHNMKQH